MTSTTPGATVLLSPLDASRPRPVALSYVVCISWELGAYPPRSVLSSSEAPVALISVMAPFLRE